LNEITKADIKNYLDNRISKTSIYAARKDLICLKGSLRIALEENHITTNPTLGIKQFKIPEKQPLYLSKEEYEKLESVITDVNFKDLVKLAVNTGFRAMEILSLKWKQVNFDEKVIVLDNRTHVTKSKRIRTIPMNQHVYDLLIKRNENCNDDNLIFDYLKHHKQEYISQNDVSIYYVSKLLGHADIKTTEIYAHIKSDNLREAVNNLL
jgi:integrase